MSKINVFALFAIVFVTMVAFAPDAFAQEGAQKGFVEAIITDGGAIGWVIVALVVVWGFGMIVGWIAFVVRSFVWIVVIGVLVVAYLSLRAPPDD